MRAILAAAALATAVLGHPAQAASFDGQWSVLVITESGTCDQAYRYLVRVGQGKVAYAGDASINLSGTVSDAGAVRVSISKGEQHANGTGRLSASGGTGTWVGKGAGGECKGRWEAERR